MFNNVVLAGVVGEKIGRGFRYLKNRHLKLHATKYDWHDIPCLYWSRDDDNLLTAIKEGTEIVLQGRIEYDDKIGLYVLVNIIQIVELK